jgi:hypothetical protein
MNGKFGLDYHNDKKMAKWFVIELYTKCKAKGLYEGWSCFIWGKLLVD